MEWGDNFVKHGKYNLRQQIQVQTYLFIIARTYKQNINVPNNKFIVIINITYQNK